MTQYTVMEQKHAPVDIVDLVSNHVLDKAVMKLLTRALLVTAMVPVTLVVKPVTHAQMIVLVARALVLFVATVSVKRAMEKTASPAPQTAMDAKAVIQTIVSAAETGTERILLPVPTRDAPRVVLRALPTQVPLSLIAVEMVYAKGTKQRATVQLIVLCLKFVMTVSTMIAMGNRTAVIPLAHQIHHVLEGNVVRIRPRAP